MTDYDSIWRMQDEIRTVVNAVLGEVFQTIDGNIYIIGSKERPYPTVKITRSTGL